MVSDVFLFSFLGHCTDWMMTRSSIFGCMVQRQEFVAEPARQKFFGMPGLRVRALLRKIQGQGPVVVEGAVAGTICVNHEKNTESVRPTKTT